MPPNGGLQGGTGDEEHPTAAWVVEGGPVVSSSNPVMTIGDALPAMLARTRRLWEEGHPFPGLATGLTDLDGLLGGLQPGTLTVVASVDRAARQAFINGLLLHVAVAGARPVLYGVREPDPVQLAIQLASAAGSVPWSSTWRGRLTAPEWSRLEKAVGKLGPAPLWILDHSILTTDSLVATIDAMPWDPDGKGMVVVDRLSQVVAHEEGQLSQDNLRLVREIAASRSLAVVTFEATDPAAPLRSDPRPKLADLPQSAVWIDHAEAIVLIHDDSAIDPGSARRGTVELHVAANRHGPVGMCRVAHRSEVGTMSNMEADQ